MVALLTFAAVLLDAALGEARRWHPLVGFGRWAQWLERQLNPRSGAHRPLLLRLRGILAVLVAVVPWVLLLAAITIPAFGSGSPAIRCAGYLVAVGALYFALGHQSLREHALGVHRALNKGDLAEARMKVGFIVSRDTGQMDGQA